MSCYKEGKVWRYQFEHKKERYSKSGFATWSEAIAAREEHKKQVKGNKTRSDTASNPTFHDVAYEYIDYSRTRFSEKNWKGKVYIFKQFHAFSKNPPFREIDSRLVERYLGILSRKSNFNRHRKALCSLFAWGFKRQLIPVNPCVYVEAMPHRPAARKIPSQDEMLKIIIAAGEQRVFFLALFSLAARLGEINNLRWEDVIFERHQVTLWTRKGDGTPRAQKKSMNQELYGELKLLWDRHAGTWVFPNPETGLPYQNRRKQIRNACRLAGVPYYSWHCIRHHVASLLADTHKESLPTIQKMLGHQNVTTTARYIQSLSQDVVEAAEKLTLVGRKSAEEIEDQK